MFAPDPRKIGDDGPWQAKATAIHWPAMFEPRSRGKNTVIHDCDTPCVWESLSISCTRGTNNNKYGVSFAQSTSIYSIVEGLELLASANCQILQRWRWSDRNPLDRFRSYMSFKNCWGAVLGGRIPDLKAASSPLKTKVVSSTICSKHSWWYMLVGGWPLMRAWRMGTIRMIRILPHKIWEKICVACLDFVSWTQVDVRACYNFQAACTFAPWTRSLGCGSWGDAWWWVMVVCSWNRKIEFVSAHWQTVLLAYVGLVQSKWQTYQKI